MDIDKIRNEALTEDAKLEMIADYLEGDAVKPTLDKVLGNGNTADNKQAKFQIDKDNYIAVSGTSISGQKTTENGVADFQVTADGSFYLDFQPTSGTLSTFQIKMNGGTPKVIMSDDIKAAFKAELGIE